MPRTERLVCDLFTQFLSGPDGLEVRTQQITGSDVGALPILTGSDLYRQNISPELLEKSCHVRYPAVYIYCEKAVNALATKFSAFSGKVSIAAEIRVSAERTESLADQLQRYVEILSDILGENRGQWTTGVYFNGGYEVTYSAVKRGGQNFVQTAWIRFDVDIHT